MKDERFFADVLAELHNGKKSGGLYVSIVETSEDILRIYFEAGNIYHLRYGSAIGNDCLDILEYYNLYSATFFEGVRAPDEAARNIPPTREIIAKIRTLNKKVRVR